MILALLVYLCSTTQPTIGHVDYSLEPVAGEPYSRIVAVYELPEGSGNVVSETIRNGVYSMRVVSTLAPTNDHGEMTLIRVDDMTPLFIVAMPHRGKITIVHQDTTLGRVRLFSRAGETYIEDDMHVDDARLRGVIGTDESWKGERVVRTYKYIPDLGMFRQMEDPDPAKGLH